LLIIPTADLPVMNRGRGVMLQKYRGGGLSDLTCFTQEEGLSWTRGGKSFRLPEWREWVGRRGAGGRFVPQGFPRSTRFS